MSVVVNGHTTSKQKRVTSFLTVMFQVIVSHIQHRRVLQIIIHKYRQSDSRKQLNKISKVKKRKEETKLCFRILTTGSGASSSLHMTQGTPVSSPTAIFAAQVAYL